MKTQHDIMVTLSSIRKGAFVGQCNDLMGELVKACFEQEGDGEIQITLKVKMNSEGQVTLKPQCKIKKPVRSVGDAIFYATVDGDLKREDPRQGEFDVVSGKVRKFGEEDIN